MSPSHNVSFNHDFQFRDLDGGSGVYPAIVVGLIGPTGEDELLALIDSGATYCLFNGKRAKSIGLDLQSGKRVPLSGLSGPLLARVHRVDLEIMGSRFSCEVAFSEQDIQRELLGRHDLFARVRFGFREGISTGYFHPRP